MSNTIDTYRRIHSALNESPVDTHIRELLFILNDVNDDEARVVALCFIVRKLADELNQLKRLVSNHDQTLSFHGLDQ